MRAWTDIAALERLARFAPYVFLVLGFIVALFGQLAKSGLESRITTLKAAAVAVFKGTPPKMEAYLADLERTGDLLVVIDAENLVPFRAHWVIVTDKNEIVSGVMLKDLEIHPSEDSKRFSAKADIKQEKVVNEYIELRFRYESMYSAELGNPSELRGEIVRRYRFKGGKLDVR